MKSHTKYVLFDGFIAFLPTIVSLRQFGDNAEVVDFTFDVMFSSFLPKTV